MKKNVFAAFILFIGLACVGGLNAKAQTCEANAGTPAFPEDVLFQCYNDGSKAPKLKILNANTTPEYKTYFLISQQADVKNIVAVNYIDQIDGKNLGLIPNNYRVHSLNMRANQEATVMGLINDKTVKTIPDLATEIGKGIICADVDETGVPYTLLKPITIDVTEVCDTLTPEEGDGYVLLVIKGGYPEYDPANGLYQVYGDFTGQVAYGDTVKIPVSGGASSYIAEVVDDQGCATIINGEMDCIKCGFVQSLTPTGLQWLCAEKEISVLATGINLTGDMGLMYALHQKPLPEIGIIYALKPATDTTKAVSFSINDIPADSCSRTYYISPLVGTVDGSGNIIDLDDSCTEWGDGTPVIMLCPIEIETLDTDLGSDLHNLLFSIKGGQPQYDKIGTYTLAGVITGAATYDTNPTVDINGPANWELTVTDGKNCTGSTSGFITAVDNLLSQNTQALQISGWQYNAVNQTLSIQCQTKNAGKTQFELYDVTGRIVQRLNVQLSSGGHNINIPANNLESGVYVIKISTSAKTITQKCVLGG